MCANDTTETIQEAQPTYAVSATHWSDAPLIVERSGRRAWVLEHDPCKRMTADQWHAQFAAMDRFAAHFAEGSDDELTDELAEALAAVRG